VRTVRPRLANQDGRAANDLSKVPVALLEPTATRGERQGVRVEEKDERD
jgi:hypothetical protein